MLVGLIRPDRLFLALRAAIGSPRRSATTIAPLRPTSDSTRNPGGFCDVALGMIAWTISTGDPSLGFLHTLSAHAIASGSSLSIKARASSDQSRPNSCEHEK